MAYYEEHICPKCGAVLDSQSGFDSHDQTHICAECGQTLYGDDVYDGDKYPGVMWYCDECGELLNTQFGFTDEDDDWTCTNCGHENSISDDEIYDSESKYFAHQVADAAMTAGDILIKGTRFILAESAAQEQREKAKRAAWRRAHWKGITCAIVVAAFLLLCGVCVFVFNRLIPIGLSEQELINTEYKGVVQQFKAAGFSNLQTVALEDLTLEKLEEDGLVAQIRLYFFKSFEETTKYPYDAKIVILYHSLHRIHPPLSASEVKGRNVSEVETVFRDAGYVNIKLEKQQDVIFGLFAKEGSVAQVSIDSNESFTKSDSFLPNSNLVIVYHGKKNGS